MSYRTPAQIQGFLDEFSHRLDGPSLQWRRECMGGISAAEARSLGILSQVCPNCGGCKYRYSAQCRPCQGSARRDVIDPRFAPKEVPDTVEIAYAAGFFEGEGSVGFYSAGTFTVTMFQNEAWPLERVRRFFGGSLRRDRVKGWYLEMHGKLAKDFVAAIELHLSPRRLAQVAEARSREAANRQRVVQNTCANQTVSR